MCEFRYLVIGRSGLFVVCNNHFSESNKRILRMGKEGIGKVSKGKEKGGKREG